MSREDAQRALRAAMDRYGFKDADRAHVTDVGALACWCSPETRCSNCGAGICACGTPLVIVHRRAS